jgi:hypothetical protein
MLQHEDRLLCDCVGCLRTVRGFDDVTRHNGQIILNSMQAQDLNGHSPRHEADSVCMPRIRYSGTG